MEFSAIARTCLNKHISTKKELETQVLVCAKEREKQKIKINWQFDITHARRKMNRHYIKLNSVNFEFKNT